MSFCISAAFIPLSLFRIHFAEDLRIPCGTEIVSSLSARQETRRNQNSSLIEQKEYGISASQGILRSR